MKILSSMFLVIFFYNRISNGYRILAVTPLQSKSHWAMMEVLIKGLLERGHEVDAITHFALKTAIPNNNYTEINMGNILPQFTNNVNVTMAMKNFTSFFFIPSIVPTVGSTNCDLLGHSKIQNLMKKSQQNRPYDVIIVSVFIAPCFLALGRFFKTPLIGQVSTSFYDWLNYASGNPMNPAYVPSVFSSFQQRMNFKERLTNYLLTNIYTMQMSYYSNAQLQQVKTHLGIDVPSIDDLYADVALYLLNSHHSLNEIRSFNPGVVEVSGMHLENKDEPLSPQVQKWLDESRDGCVYFTLGSMITIESFSKELMQQIYMSFEKIAPVRVLMKVVKKNDLLPGLPKNVMTHSWFPQLSVLKHKNTRAFITHGGLLGTQEAVAAGIPLIGIPIFSDQHRNIENLVNKKVAISLKSINDITEEKLTLALNNILKDPSYRNNMQRLSTLFLDRPMSPLNMSIYWVEYIARYGNVFESPAIHLYWWQRNLLDIYTFIFAIIIAILYVALFIFRKLRNFLCRSRVHTNNDAAIKSKKTK